MPIPFLDLPAQYRALRAEIDPAIERVLESAKYASGPAVEQFEEDFAAFCGTRHCIGVNSGTAALTLLLRAHDIGPGDDVITVANTFFATVEAILHVGATPVLVDVEEETALMDPHLLERAITAHTKAIIPVHLYGQTADMASINTVAQERNLLVFEDACQAHGAMEGHRFAGNLADGAAFSFYPGKNLGAFGEAGAVTTHDPAIAKTIRMLRDHGQSEKYRSDLVGWNERMDSLQGAVLSVKLRHLAAWNERRRALAAHYRTHLPSTVRTIAKRPGATSIEHLFVIRTPNRDALQKHLSDRGIQTGIHYPIPIHLQPAMKQSDWKRGDFPVSEQLAGEILSLPIFPEMTERQVEEVCETIAACSA